MASRLAALTALSTLTTRLGGRVHLGVPDAPGDEEGGAREEATREGAAGRTKGRGIPTGIAALDRAIGGGFPRGRLSELVGGASSGKLSLALASLRNTIEESDAASEQEAGAFRDAPRGVPRDPPRDPPRDSPRGALIDLSGTTCPASDWATGRLLVVRPPDATSALRALDLLLASGALELVVLEASGGFRGIPRRTGSTGGLVPDALGLRLARLAREVGTAIVGCSERPLFGTASALRLELRPDADGVLEVHVARHRSGAPGTVRIERPGWPAELPRRDAGVLPSRRPDRPDRPDRFDRPDRPDHPVHRIA